MADTHLGSRNPYDGEVMLRLLLPWAQNVIIEYRIVAFGVAQRDSVAVAEESQQQQQQQQQQRRRHRRPQRGERAPRGDAAATAATSLPAAEQSHVGRFLRISIGIYGTLGFLHAYELVNSLPKSSLAQSMHSPSKLQL